MSSTAVSAQNTVFRIAAAAAVALSITGITKASPAVVSAANTLAVGDVLVFGAVTGMPEITGRIGIVLSATTASFTVNIDSTGFGAAGTTGTALPQTWTKVANIKDYTGFDGTVGQRDVSNLDSRGREYRKNLQDYGQFSMNIDFNSAEPGHIALLANKQSNSNTYFQVKYPDATMAVFFGFVTKFGQAGGVDNDLKSAVDIKISERPSYSFITD